MSADTSPVLETVATAESSLDQVTGRPARGAPFVSRAAAMTCTCEPMASAAVSGSTETKYAGLTVIVPVVNSTVAPVARASPLRSRTARVTTS